MVFLKLTTGYRVMACIYNLMHVLAAGSPCYGALPVVGAAEWRLGLYKHGQMMYQTFFDLVSPVEEKDFRGEFGLFNLLQLACEKIAERVAHDHYGVKFVMSNIFLTREF